MSTHLRRGVAGVAAALLLLTFAGCGDDDGEGSSSSTTTTTESETTTEATEPTETTEAPGSTAAPESSEVPDTSDPGEPTTPPPSDEGGTVSVADFAFDPTPLEVAVDTEVTWTNDDGPTHTVTDEDGAFDSGDLPPGESYSYVFREAGTFTYLCDIHPSMSGEVVVE